MTEAQTNLSRRRQLQNVHVWSSKKLFIVYVQNPV